MKKLCIKNFGPISKGFTDSEDGFFDISKLSVFIGEQGAGKSSVAKLISLFSWLEKHNQKSDERVSLIDSTVFADKYLKYHRIDSYLRSDTEIYYVHDNFSISFCKNQLRIESKNKNYIRPKVLYIPAERSFCTAITNPYKVPGLPPSVIDFLSDYYDAVKAQKGNKILLPLNGYEFRFSEADNMAYISDKNHHYEIKVEDSSSGLQSLTPMYVTINHYLEQLKQSIDERHSELNLYQIVELKHLSEKKELFPEDVKKEQKKIINSNLICVIEEPEQNLFPSSQYDIMMTLLKGFSNLTDNTLIITTHSPYILETINNSIYADTLTKNNKDTRKYISLEQQISYDNVSAYSIQNGEIHSIKDSQLKQINPSSIDFCSQKISDIYSKLSDIEYGDL